MTVTFKAFTSNMGGTSANTYIGNSGELFWDPSVGHLRISNGTTPGGNTILSESVPTFGCFHKMADVTANTANTVYDFDWFTDVTQHVGDHGVTVTSGQPTRLNINTAGDYMVHLEMIVRINGNAERNVFLWLAKNGNNIAETGVKISLRQGNAPTYQTIAKPWLIHNISPNDYIELRFALSRVDDISLEFTQAQTSPYIRPAIPSAVITVVSI